MEDTWTKEDLGTFSLLDWRLHERWKDVGTDERKMFKQKEMLEWRKKAMLLGASSICLPRNSVWC